MSRRASTQSTLINERFTPLTEDEINAFIDDLDHNNDGKIQYSEVEAKLDQVNDELTPDPTAHNINHPSKEDVQRHAFLRSILGDADALSRDEFAARVRGWGIPSMKQDQEEQDAERDYIRRLGTWRRFRSWWAVRGPEVVFIGLVIGSMIGFGLWQCLKYGLETRYTAAFGWGVVMAKTCAGALYPTLFFLILSMSRNFSTFLRRWYLVSRFINWDLSQSFHIKMSLAAIALATLHAIGHLSGSFVFGSKPNRQDAVAVVLSPDLVPRPYIEYIRSLPGFTGLTALGLFYLILLLSIPPVRRWNYEVFQLGHLLMYPIIGLLMAHGTAKLLQGPMLGYFLAFPTLLVVVERITRVFIGFRHIEATIQILDSETVQIAASISPFTAQRYRPGQYVFMQVPSISFFQWHPFTVSTCVNNQLHLHIKTDGNWTQKLRDLASEDREAVSIKIGLDGPFGAPAERFYDYSHTVLVGSGIGVTPFSGILADLQAGDDLLHGGPSSREKGGHGAPDVDTTRVNSTSSGTNANNEKPSAANSLTRALSRTLSRRRSRSRSRRNSTSSPFPEDYRRIDFHWMVRDKNHLTWFSNLLNAISRSQEWHRAHTRDSDSNAFPHLDIRLQTHVTAKRKSITTHVYRWLLELHRTDEHPESPLTGLINPSHYGRPDFVKILDRHYEDMVEYRTLAGGTNSSSDRLKVGVFFCGAPMIGEILADRCRELTKRGAEEGTGIQYHLMIEVFG
ncbi:uncharacterized protein I303_107582 [Kwoniella dejecticola CBS 10117]|uniref:FAD-binding FR-type domain-containing protein n=1 Tax=Kwoniella dejecticola CBS 10117 TaxID=1296121 RepID=A0A1A5ZV47_9TREE|nr:uncharacterized protein I303_07592 [Kwoniella dejecticola CBS 10117]OBR81682.1 hypothetical protein I303_07592 [Kwoniella dejecticola CBS 10117]